MLFKIIRYTVKQIADISTWNCFFVVVFLMCWFLLEIQVIITTMTVVTVRCILASLRVTRRRWGQQFGSGCLLSTYLSQTQWKTLELSIPPLVSCSLLEFSHSRTLLKTALMALQHGPTGTSSSLVRASLKMCCDKRASWMVFSCHRLCMGSVVPLCNDRNYVSYTWDSHNTHHWALHMVGSCKVLK